MSMGCRPADDGARTRDLAIPTGLEPAISTLTTWRALHLLCGTIPDQPGGAGGRTGRERAVYLGRTSERGEDTRSLGALRSATTSLDSPGTANERSRRDFHPARPGGGGRNRTDGERKTTLIPVLVGKSGRPTGPNTSDVQDTRRCGLEPQPLRQDCGLRGGAPCAAGFPTRRRPAGTWSLPGRESCTPGTDDSKHPRSGGADAFGPAPHPVCTLAGGEKVGRSLLPPPVDPPGLEPGTSCMQGRHSPR